MSRGDRMPPARNLECKPRTNRRPHEVRFDRKIGKPGKHVETRHDTCDLAQGAARALHVIDQLIEQLQLDRERLARGIRNLRRKIGEFGVRMPLRLRRRLAMNERASRFRGL